MSYTDFDKLLTKYLLITLEAAREIDVQRNILGRILMFEPYAAFKRINRKNNKKIDLKDLCSFLKDNGVKYSEKFVKELVSLYDRNKDGSWNYEEFLSFCLPHKDKFLRSQIVQRENYSVGESDFLPYEIEASIAKLIECELGIFNDQIFFLEKLKDNPNFKPQKNFVKLDSEKRGFLDENAFYTFFRKYGYDVTKYDLFYLMTRLDRDGDGVINFNDYKDLFFGDFFKVFKKSEGGVGSSNNGMLKSVAKISSSKVGTSSFSRSIKPENTSVSTTSREKSVVTEKKVTTRGKSNNIARPTTAKAAPMKTNNANYHNPSSTKSSNTALKKTPDNSSATSSKHRAQSIDFSGAMKNNITKEKNISVIDGLTAIDPLRQSSPRTKINSNNSRSDQLNDHFPLSFTHKSRLPNPNLDFVPMSSNKPKYDDNSTEHFAKYLCELLKYETELETIKEKICLKHDVFLRDIFYWFDYTQQGFFERKDFKRVMNHLGIDYTDESVALVFERFSVRRNEKIIYDEFKSIFTPTKQEYLQMIRQREIEEFGYYYKDVMSAESKSLVIKLFRCLIQNESQNHNQRKLLKNKVDATNCFKLLQCGSDAIFLTKNHFKTFLEDVCIFPSNFEIEVLFNRFYGNADGKVSFSQLVEVVDPPLQ